jgi:hypothetical protein
VVQGVIEVKIKLKDEFYHYTDSNCAGVRLDLAAADDEIKVTIDSEVDADDCVELAEFFLTLARKLRARE